MRAVVKNRPKQYFKQNENWNLYVVLCLYMSVNLWNKFAITSLLNKTTKEIMAKTIAYALIWSPELWYYRYLSMYAYTIDDFFFETNAKTTVRTTKTSKLNNHPVNMFLNLVLAGRDMFSQINSRGSGTLPNLACFQLAEKPFFSKFYKAYSLSGSVDMMTIALLASNLFYLSSCFCSLMKFVILSSVWWISSCKVLASSDSCYPFLYNILNFSISSFFFSYNSSNSCKSGIKTIYYILLFFRSWPNIVLI